MGKGKLKSRVTIIISAAICLEAAVAVGAEQSVSLTINSDSVVHRIDEKIYGHFLEHIYHSVNGGLWGEMIWNRSFEQNTAGQWSVEEGAVVQRSLATNQRLVFGEAAWSDYEFTLEARKTGGSEGFLILFRVKTEKTFYWCNLGGWNNVRHQLERGRERDQRWGGVGPSVNGRIEKDRWYPIKVRCEGPRIRVWLDGELLIDFSDPSGHRTGAVGIGTWATQAQFRNMKIVSLDGEVLFEGLPQVEERPSVALHWKSFGSGIVTLDTRDPLNARYSQKVVTRKDHTGIEQGAMCLRRGQTYDLSVWARGRAASGLVVRLLDGDDVLDEHLLGNPDAEWKEYTVALSPKADADEATIQVGVSGAAEIWIDQVSLMPRNWMDAGGFRPDLLKAIADLKPPTIRWPGGCFASSYQWKDGIGPQHKRLPHPREIWDDLDVYSFGTDEFVRMCRAVGAEPLIVVNMGSRSWNSDADTHDYTQDILDWIEYCNGPADSKWGKVRAANGHREPYNVKFWEIDNETWHTPASRYAEEVLRLAPLMKKVDPSIKLLACGSGGMGRNNANGMPYNRTVIERCADVLDYISIHHYESPNRFADGPRDYETFFRELGAMIKSSSNPKLKIYVSEWNAQSTDWRTGLYCGGLLNAFERCGDILEMGGPALFLRHVSATAWDNAFINFDQRTWFGAPNYVVMKLYREHYAPNLMSLTGDTGGLGAVATKSEDGKHIFLKLVNPTENAADAVVTIEGAFTPSQANLKLISPGSLRARNSLDEPDAVEPVSGQIRTEGKNLHFTLPGWSVGVVELAK